MYLLIIAHKELDTLGSHNENETKYAFAQNNLLHVENEVCATE